MLLSRGALLIIPLINELNSYEFIDYGFSATKAVSCITVNVMLSIARKTLIFLIVLTTELTIVRSSKA